MVQNQGSVQISGKNNAGGDVTLAESAYTITVAPDANNSVMTVAFTPSALTGVAGGEITITYTATVQSGAVGCRKRQREHCQDRLFSAKPT